MIIDADVYLEHFGVKGMRWGVRNQRQKTGYSGSKSGHAGSLKSGLSPKQKQKNLADSNKKFADKWGGLQFPESKSSSGSLDFTKTPTHISTAWHPTEEQKHIAEIGAAALVAGGVLFAVREKRLKDIREVSALAKPFSAEDYSKTASKFLPSFVDDVKPGQNVSASSYMGACTGSKLRSWSSGYVNAESFAQKEMEFPAGHTFRRFSKTAESSFKDGTYCVSNDADFNRYVTMFGAGEGGSRHVISFDAKQKIRIPDLHTTLETLRVEMQKQSAHVVTPDEVLQKYKVMSGGVWSKFGLEGKLIGSLKKQGYHGVVDQMDAGVLGESPLTLFDSSALGAKTSKPFTALMVQHAYKGLTEIANRK